MHLLSRFSIYKYFFILCWTIVWCSETKNLSPIMNQSLISNNKIQTDRSEGQVLSWSPWGPWSSCSRTCGGGVAVQERFCLPTEKAKLHPERRRRRLRSIVSAGPLAASNAPCQGISRRYHECNTLPCRASVQDPRAEQCSAFNKRPFKGRYFNWLPFVEGSSPCVLNCRPLGHQFYATLGLVADGTPCTKPPYRAICIKGQCQAVGHEGVLSTSSVKHPSNCGRRLVSGLFTKSRLPLGYNLVTTVPSGACNLNVTELTNSDNYLVLKVTNSPFIFNGDFAISLPGHYEAAGAHFLYKRETGAPETIFSAGPLHQPIDIMILYRHPNPAIKYKYFVDGSPKEQETNEIEQDFPPTGDANVNHRRRSHDSYPTFDTSSSRFIWKTTPFTKCSRSCGGGMQISKWKCYEDGTMAEASATQCSQPPPAPKRRKCNIQPCPPRWRVFSWSECPPCGSGKSTRKVVCIKEHSRIISTVADRECELPKPVSEKQCPYIACTNNLQTTTTTSTTTLPTTDGRRHTKPKVELFKDSPIITRYSNVTRARSESDNEITKTRFGIGSWTHTDWTECKGWCGVGVRSRQVHCTEGEGGCLSSNAPAQYESCDIYKPCDSGKPQPMWFTGPWSECTSPCLWGRRIRVVVCASSLGRRLRDSVCAKMPKPPAIESCQGPGICQYDWLIGDWGECAGPCGTSVETRIVKCEGDRCPLPAPPATRPCASPACYPSDIPRVMTQSTSATLITPRLTRHYEAAMTSSTTPMTPIGNRQEESCEDILSSCALAAQARLCSYPYYVKFCCHSCRQ